MQQPPLPARLGQQLGVVSTLYRGLIERLLAPHDVTWAQFTLLLHLARREGASRISEIAAAIELTQPAVSKVVQKFAHLRWIDIGRDDTDARNRPVRITTEGLARLAAMQRSFGPVFGELLDGWQQAELERLIADLKRLAEKLNALSVADRKR